MNFLGQYDKIHRYKTTTMMHILIRAPPPYRVQTASSSCPPRGGVWPRPGSGILVYLPPGRGHPLTPCPPPHTKVSDPIPLTSLIFVPFPTFRLPLPYTILGTLFPKIFLCFLAHGTVPHTHIYRICATVVFPSHSVS